MKTIGKIFNFFYGGTLKYVLFLFAVVLVAWFVMILIAWPWQTVSVLVSGFVLYTLFCFFDEL